MVASPACDDGALDGAEDAFATTTTGAAAGALLANVTGGGDVTLAGANGEATEGMVEGMSEGTDDGMSDPGRTTKTGGVVGDAVTDGAEDPDSSTIPEGAWVVGGNVAEAVAGASEADASSSIWSSSSSVDPLLSPPPSPLEEGD